MLTCDLFVAVNLVVKQRFDVHVLSVLKVKQNFFYVTNMLLS